MVLLASEGQWQEELMLLCLKRAHLFNLFQMSHMEAFTLCTDFEVGAEL